MAASCGVSLAAGLGLVFRLVTPDSIVHLRTPELLGLLALLVMPVLVLAAVRGHRARPVHASPEPRDQSSAVHEIVVLAPDLRDRSAERHRRRHSVQSRRTAA